MAKRATKTAADFGVLEVVVHDYFLAGTGRAHDALTGDFTDVSCVCCGAKITHVFFSTIGPLGGDCAATLTGDDSTRRIMRVGVAKCVDVLKFWKGPNTLVVSGKMVGRSWGTFFKAAISCSSHEVAKMVAAAALESWQAKSNIVGHLMIESAT